MKKVFALAVLCVVGFGCSSSPPADQDLEAWTQEVKVMTPNQIGDRQYEELAGFEEKERIGIGNEENAISSAKNRLRVRAAKVDADAVVIIACGRNIRPMEEDRMPSTDPVVVCHGIAIRWLD